MSSRGDKLTFSSESKYYPMHTYLSRLGEAGPLHIEFAKLEEYLASPCLQELAPIRLGGETAVAVTLSRVPGFWQAGA